MNQPTWHILGFGAIGQILHGGFAQEGQRCKVIVKHGWDESDTHRVTRDGQTREIPIEWVKASDTGAIAHLLVCTKSYDAIEAIQSVSESLNADSHIIILINGMLDAEDVRAASRGANLYWGLTTEGGYRTSTLHTVHAGTGLTKIGGGPRPAWFDLWTKAHPRSEWVADIEPHRWEKLCINAAINPLTALNACQNGALVHEPLFQTTNELITELSMLLRAHGYEHLAKAFPTACRRVIEQTASNQSSMYQDTQHLKKTEIDLIVPPLLRFARARNIATPVLNKIYDEFISQFGPSSTQAQD